MNAIRKQSLGLAKLLHEDAHRAWGVPERTALIVFVVPFAGAILVAAARGHLPTFQLITAEDGLLEWLQVVGYAAASVLALLLSRLLLRRGDVRFAAAYAMLAIGCMFVAGEEISWGQRILGIETPENLQELNRQGELGVHNVGTLETIFQLTLLVAGLYGSAGVWLIRSRWQRSESRMLALLVPPVFLSSFFLLVFLHRLVRFTVPNVTDVTAFVKFGEWPELCFASALATFCALNLRRLRRWE